jgi:endonuclease VIII-like 1
MPELAELRISSDYINYHTRDKSFKRIVKSSRHRGPNIYFPEGEFEIITQSRGKELLMLIVSKTQAMNVRFNFGMSGGFKLSKTGEEPKYSHLQFISTDGFTLSYVDRRSFGTWHLDVGWSPDRSPCPNTEYLAFEKNILDGLDCKDLKDFNKPIYEVMMNQKWFNGIGNYLRAEILYKLNRNPFISAREYINDCPELLMLCKTFTDQCIKVKLNEIYNVQENYTNSVDSLLRCYKHPDSAHIIDKNGRVFWYDSKFKLNE